MGAGEIMQLMTRDIADGVERCRLSCDYFSVCGGGAPVNKLTENGLFASDRTRFCELTQMVPTDLILDALERIDPILQQPDPSSSPTSWRTQCREHSRLTFVALCALGVLSTAGTGAAAQPASAQSSPSQHASSQPADDQAARRQTSHRMRRSRFRSLP